MSDPLCRDCSDLQLVVKATRIMGKTPVCERHMRQRLGMPATEADLRAVETKKEDTRMATRTDDATRAEILKDFKEGKLGINAIANKHNVAWITAKNIIDSRAEGQKSASAPRPKKSSAPSRGSAAPTLVATAELCDGIWAALSLDKKAALLNRLHEAN